MVSFDAVRGSCKRALKASLFGVALGCAAMVQAAPITGEELPGSSSFDAASTNALNYSNSNRQYVLFEENAAGEVTLAFYNPTRFDAWFEYRIDGVDLPGGSAHPIVAGGFVQPYITLAAGASAFLQTFTANEYVEIRTAFGPEQDWYFDWTAFPVAAAAVPEPAVPAMLALGLLGIAIAQRRRRSTH